MTGLRPIVDMTFMDFSVIAMDNIVNQAAKTRYMFGGKGQVPMTVRCAAGNGVGSAAQHSQSLESWFTHIPGLEGCSPWYASGYEKDRLSHLSVITTLLSFLSTSQNSTKKGSASRSRLYPFHLVLGKSNVKERM